MRGTGGNVIADVPESRLNCICCLWNDFFYKEELLKMLPLSYMWMPLFMSPTLNFCFNLLINLLYICKLGIV